MHLTALTSADLADHTGALGELLADAVAGGASVGFSAGLTPDEAAGWWRGLAGPLAEGQLLLWAAFEDHPTERGGRLLGTVQLRLTSYPNGRHRAELAKLLVHGAARGRGLGRRLLAHAEAEAAARGLTLLLLDTETGSPAEHLYRSAGWTELGTVPGHATDPGGQLRPTTFYFKTLAGEGSSAVASAMVSGATSPTV
ncbi:GNAT family N-acetyltransferase [Kitasatospora sp. NPDC096147]|uniref:GNAT family N-acetyltransferase n=1 Tax=Kitasatospora sp. NPDC096147 TaxID=3364093 RepID=UPI0038100753